MDLRHLGSAPLLIVYIFLDTLECSEHNPACFTGRFSFSFTCWAASAFSRQLTLPARRSHAIFARMDGAVLEPGMPRARTLAARRRRARGSLQQLRQPIAQRAAAAGAAIPDAAPVAGRLSPDDAPPALSFFEHGDSGLVSSPPRLPACSGNTQGPSPRAPANAGSGLSCVTTQNKRVRLAGKWEAAKGGAAGGGTGRSWAWG